MTAYTRVRRAIDIVSANTGRADIEDVIRTVDYLGGPSAATFGIPPRRPNVVRALQQALTNECAKRGGSANMGPDGLIAINTVVDPEYIVSAVNSALIEDRRAKLAEDEKTMALARRLSTSRLAGLQERSQGELVEVAAEIMAFLQSRDK